MSPILRLFGAVAILAMALLGLSARSARADFVYANFATVNSTSGGQTLQVNGSASVGYLHNQLQLTPPIPSLGGSAFTTNAIPLGNNASFSTYFQFQLSNSGGALDEDGLGADGIAFVVQTVSNNVGAAGFGIGYFGIPNSIGIEFDTYDNGEISGNHVGIDENGGLQDFGAVNEPTRFNNGQIWNAWIDYDGVAQALHVRWSLLPTRPAGSMLTLNGVNLPAILGTNNAFVGFTAATGDGYNDQDILNWQFNQSPGVWVGATDANWTTPSNWLGAVPGATTGTTNTDTATFNLNTPNSPLGIDAGRNIKNITFDTANVNSMTIGTTGGNALLLTAGGTVQTTSTVVNAQTINCPLVLEGDYTFTSGAANSAATLSFGGRITPGVTSGVTTLTLGGINAGNNTISGILADNGAGKLAIAMAGPGVWVLSGANTYTGGTSINAGTLQLGDAISANGSVAGNITDKAMLVFANPSSQTYSGVVSGAGSVVKTAAGTLVLSGANTYTGGTTINEGTLQLGDGVSANGSVAGNITDKTALVFANPNSQTYSGVISGAGTVVKTAAGTLVLSGANSFTGGLSVQQGTLSIPTINNVGATGPIGAGPTVPLGSMEQTGTLEYTGGTAASNMPFSLATGGSGVLQIDTASTSLSLSGVVSGSGALSKSGPGALIFSGSNTFTGGLAINAGMVQLGNSGALNSTTPNYVHFGPASTGILNLGGSGNVTISSLQSNTVTGSPIVENANSISGQISTLTVNDSGTDTFAGVMRDDPAGNGILAIGKSGAGTLILTAANTYTGGTTINAGTLQLGDGVTSNGSVAGDIGDNSALVFANPNAQTYSGGLFGSGAVTKTAPGTLTLSGSNSFTGGLTVQQGTLSISTINNAHTVGSLGANSSVTLSLNGQTAMLDFSGGTAFSNMPFTLTAGGNSVFQVDSATTNLNLTGILSGGGNLTKTGAGTLTFGSRNTYAGSTTVNNGTLATTTTGGLGGGSLVVNGNSGASSTLSLGSNQSVASLSGTVVAGSSARVNVGAGTTFNVAQATNTTFAGAVALANGSTGGTGGAVNKSGVGTLEIDGGITLGNNSTLAVSGGKLRLNVNSGTGNVGSGATANISGSAVLELAGSTSVLGTSLPNSRVATTNTSSAAAGLLISAGNQQVGGINGNGKTQINAGASLTADHIVQSALTIGGTSGSRGVVVIDASDSTGNPLAGSIPLSLGEPLSNGLDAMRTTGMSDTLRLDDAAQGNVSLLNGNTTPDGTTSAVPEPSTLALLTIVALLQTTLYAAGFSASHAWVS